MNFIFRKNIFLLAILFLALSCSENKDESELWKEINAQEVAISEIKRRIAQLETTVNEINDDVASLRTFFNAQSGGVFVASVETAVEGTTVRFSGGNSSFLRNGKDLSGENSPIVSVGEVDGVYFWQLKAAGAKDWLLDGKGNKLKVVGNGAVTPKVGIEEEGYWTVSCDNGKTFSFIFDQEGEKISALNKDSDGKDDAEDKIGAVPIVKTDEFCCWMVSFDNRENFKYILTSDGDKICALGKGKDEDNDEDGGESREGEALRVVVDAEGFYCFEIFHESDPGTVLRKIVTKYQSDPANAISSIVEDRNRGLTTLAFPDGAAYRFNLEQPYPTSIVVLKKKVFLTKEGSCSFDVILNPSDAVVSLDTESENATFCLNLATKTRASYVVPPTNYKISRIEKVVNGDGEVMAGKYRLTLSDLNLATNYLEEMTVVLRTKNHKGEPIEISSDLIAVEWGEGTAMENFRIGNSQAIFDGRFVNVRMSYGTDLKKLKPSFTLPDYAKVFVGEEQQFSGVSEQDFSAPVEYRVVSAEGLENSYIVSVSFSELPVVFINTEGRHNITSKTEYLQTDVYVTNSEHNAVYSKAKIKGRGHSSWDFEKKPYTLKLDKKDEFLGMAKHKTFAFVANH